MSGPLEGIMVVDCTTWLQGPFAATLLGDLGAEVIKLEQRGVGDPLRGYLVGHYQEYQRNVPYRSINRNKRGMALDLRKQQGREIIYQLIKKSDVLMHNLRPQAAKRLGLDYDALSSLNPRLVYAQASGWGLKGPESERAVFDAAAAARTGLMSILSEKGVAEPKYNQNIALCDMAGGLCLAMGILAALQARERIGRGQMVDTSVFGSTITLAAWPTARALGYGEEPLGPPRTEARNPLYNSYKCADGEWIYLIMLQFDRHWSAFCEALGIKELEKDPRFKNLEAILQHTTELIPILDRVFATRPRAEWMRILDEQGLFYAPIKKLCDLANDPQAMANDYIVEFNNPAYGPEKMAGFPYNFSETPASIRRPCPEFGQHTEEVLLELGYTWDDITKFKEEEVI